MEKQIVKSNIPLISNSFVKCYSDYLVIRLYYFPFGNKKIQYKNIRSCELHSTDDTSIWDYKLWGMALTPIWWHCDMNRLARKYYILIDTNQWPLIGLTMNDNDIIQVCNFIRQKIYSNQSNIYLEKMPYDSYKTTSKNELEHQNSKTN